MVLWYNVNILDNRVVSGDSLFNGGLTYEKYV